METSKTVFVTGITGNQGGALTNYLLKGNNNVIGLTRDASTEKSKKWKSKGVTLVEGDLSDPSSYQHQLNNADSVFLVQTLQKKENEIYQGREFVDAVRSSGEKHLVYSSVLGADLNTGVPHFDSKFELENYIKTKNINYTMLRPASFYENHLFPQVANSIKKGKYMSALNKTCKQQMIGIDDIGKIASQVITNPEKYSGKTLSIATDEHEIGNVPQLFSNVIKKPVKYKKLPGIITRLAMGKDLYTMFKYMNKNDFVVVENIPNLKEEFNITGDLQSWISKHF